MRANCISSILAALTFLAWAATPSRGDVIVPDNGSGTAAMPLSVEFAPSSPDESMWIIDGLPSGTTIKIDPVIKPPTSSTEIPGGALGGTTATGAVDVHMYLEGTGDLAGYMRTFVVPHVLESYAAPRTPDDPVQSFDTDMFRLSGQLIGDPDFDLLRITAGTGNGMPSPGHTTLTRQPDGNWAVDSFFDITYRIDFVGAPGGSLAGRSGSTTGTIRMGATPEPGTLVLLTTAAMGLALSWWARRRSKA